MSFPLVPKRKLHGVTDTGRSGKQLGRRRLWRLCACVQTIPASRARLRQSVPPLGAGAVPDTFGQMPMLERRSGMRWQLRRSSARSLVKVLGSIDSHEGLMNILTTAVVGTISLLPASGALAQHGNMMNGNTWGGGWMGGGYDSWLVPILLIVLIGVIVWAVLQGRK